jgi:hypothetical protein
VFIGPLFGWALFFLPILFFSGRSGAGSTHASLPEMVLGWGALLGLSLSGGYMIGILPAWLTALASEALILKRASVRIGVSVALGAVLSAGAAEFWLGGGSRDTALLGGIGGLAALVCGLLVSWERAARKSPAPEERG